MQRHTRLKMDGWQPTVTFVTPAASAQTKNNLRSCKHGLELQQRILHQTSATRGDQRNQGGTNQNQAGVKIHQNQKCKPSYQKVQQPWGTKQDGDFKHIAQASSTQVGGRSVGSMHASWRYCCCCCGGRPPSAGAPAAAAGALVRVPGKLHVAARCRKLRPPPPPCACPGGPPPPPPPPLSDIRYLYPRDPSFAIAPSCTSSCRRSPRDAAARSAAGDTTPTSLTALLLVPSAPQQPLRLPMLGDATSPPPLLP